MAPFVHSGKMTASVFLSLTTLLITFTCYPLSRTPPAFANATTVGPLKLSDFPTQQQVIAAVRKAESLTSPPADTQPSLQTLADGGDFGGSPTCPGPTTFSATDNVAACTFGDVLARRTIVLTGDSRSQLWFETIDSIAIAVHMRLVLLAKYGCPSPLGTYAVNNNGVVKATPRQACTAWHSFVTSTIKSLKPSLVITASSDEVVLVSGLAPPTTVSDDFAAFFKTIPKRTKLAVLGGFPNPAQEEASPTICLSKSPSPVTHCAFHESPIVIAENNAVQQTTVQAGATYINQMRWLCASVCPAIIAGIIPYTVDGYHIDATYAHYLTGVLWADLEPDLR